jgi:hypothetical protein
MQDATAGTWHAVPALPVEMLVSLRDLNHRFLDLIGAGSAPVWGGPRPDVPARIATLSGAQKAAAAACPYALFDLQFQDDAHWQARLEPTAAGYIADAPAVAGAAAAFAQLALFYAWHVAAHGTLACQLILGMSERTAAALGRTPLSRVAALVAAEAANLRARWSDCTAFWSVLVDAAGRPDEKSLRRIQLFGLQLAAAARLPHQEYPP